jgi:hypothetical protein
MGRMDPSHFLVAMTAPKITYDPYGNQTTVSGGASDIGYAGYFVSGYDLAAIIAADAAVGALTGLTDGLNLVAKAGINATVRATGEAYKEVELPLSNRTGRGLKTADKFTG